MTRAHAPVGAPARLRLPHLAAFLGSEVRAERVTLVVLSLASRREACLVVLVPCYVLFLGGSPSSGIHPLCAFQHRTPQVGLWPVSWPRDRVWAGGVWRGPPPWGGWVAGARKASWPLSKRPTSVPEARAPAPPSCCPPTADTEPALCVWLSERGHGAVPVAGIWDSRILDRQLTGSRKVSVSPHAALRHARGRSKTERGPTFPETGRHPAFSVQLALETSVLPVVCLVPHVPHFRAFGWWLCCLK